MEKEKKNIIIALSLLGVFAVALLNNMHIFDKRAPVPAAKPLNSLNSNNLSSLVSMRQNDATFREQWKRWDGDWVRDPFVEEIKVSAPASETDQLVLKGIFWDEKNPKVILNDKMLGKGDTLGTYTVLEIKPRSVILTNGQKNIEVQVFHSVPTEKTTITTL